MPQITTTIKLDLQYRPVEPVLYAKVGDNLSRKIVFELYNSGIAWSVPVGTEIAIRYMRADGSHGYYSRLPDGKPACTVHNNAVTCILVEDITAISGIAAIDLALTDNNSTLCTFSTKIIVDCAPATMGDIPPGWYDLPTLAAINKAIAVLQKARGAVYGMYSCTTASAEYRKNILNLNSIPPDGAVIAIKFDHADTSYRPVLTYTSTLGATTLTVGVPEDPTAHVELPYTITAGWNLFMVRKPFAVLLQSGGGKDDVYPTITDNVPPTTSTQGVVGQLYLDTKSGIMYKCFSIYGSTYRWEPVFNGGEVHNPTYFYHTVDFGANVDISGGLTFPNVLYFHAEMDGATPRFGLFGDNNNEQCVLGNLAEPKGAQDAATKQYVDKLIGDTNKAVSKLKNRVSLLEMQTYSHRYGVKFTGADPAGERLYDARGLVAGVSTDKEAAKNDFDNVLPWAGMRRCNTAIIDGERIPTVFEGEAGYDNINKDVFVYVPLFFYHRSADDSEHVVSMKQLPGYRAPHKFHRKDGTLRDFVFLPAYTAGLVDGVPVSRSGHYPHITSATGWMNLCKDKHTAGLDADLWIEGMADDEIKNILLDIEFATRDHQTFMKGASFMRHSSDQVTTGGTDKFTVTPEIAINYVVGQAIAIGTSDKNNQEADNATITGINTDTGEITFKPISGSVTVDAGNFISSRPWKSGACDTVQGSSGSPGSNTSGHFPCIYRGIENPYGNQSRFRWDFLMNDDQPYVLDDPNNYDGSLNGNYTALGYKVPTTKGYATAMGFDEKFPHARITSAIGGSSNTYFADHYYYSAALRVLLVGGSVYNGLSAGARSFSVTNSPSSAYWGFGAALSPA